MFADDLIIILEDPLEGIKINQIPAGNSFPCDTLWKQKLDFWGEDDWKKYQCF